MRCVLFLDPLLPINDKQIPVEIEAVSVNNGEIPPDSDRLILSHEQNLLSFYFSAWDYPIGANLNYSDRLLGLDKEWVNVGNSQQAHYSNLSPGRYTFQVRAQRLDGNWQEPGASLQIRIRPSFWASTAMKICYFAILAAVLAFFLKNRISSRLKQDKLDFITNISHEYRTPLSLIYGPVRELSASGSLTGRDRELVDIIARSAERLHRLSGQVMDLNRFENGREFLEVSRCDLSPILNDIASSFSWQMERKRLAAAVRRQDLPFLRELCGRPDVFLVDLDAPFGRLGCVIMASGLGKRFGGNKLMADFRGKPMIQYALDATEGIFERRVVVTRHREVEELCRRQNISVVFHSLPYRSDTVRLGLESLGAGTDAGKSGTEAEIKIAPPAENGLEGCMFCPGDQPMLGRETVASLALCAASEKKFIWRASWNGMEGSPVLFPAWAFPELLNLPGGKGGGFVAEKHREQVRTAAAGSRWELQDVDCPEALGFLAEIC